MGIDYDASTDLWSFACMIFELITGDFLFNPRPGSDHKKTETHPIADCILTLKKYQEKEAGLSDKYKSTAEFIELIEANFPRKTWDNPADIANISVDEMEKIMGLSGVKKKPKIETVGKNVEGDRVGKVGEWNLWLPSSRENSIEIAQYDTDPLTGNITPRTTWCTARVHGSNLFYYYIGGSGGKFMLFYIIRDNAQKSNNDDYLSLGFIDGKPILPSQDSVDRDNKGLTENRLRSIWGGSYDQIIQILTDKCNSLGGVSPAMIKIDEAAKSIEAYNSLIAGNSQEEKKEITKKIAQNLNLSVEVQKLLVEDSDADVRHHLARNPAADITILNAIVN
ncbi:MAG: hypothetical protein EB127_28580, partial [Alphaproteobacteria bacterium]|nr:hypothetical protein [Alphaproteobacteria bacterium]